MASPLDGPAVLDASSARHERERGTDHLPAEFAVQSVRAHEGGGLLLCATARAKRQRAAQGTIRLRPLGVARFKVSEGGRNARA